MNAQQVNYGGYDIEAGAPFTLKNDNVRQNFIRKVVGIVFVQFLVTALFVTAGTFFVPYRAFILSHLWLVYPCTFGVLLTFYALACFPSVARAVPTNYILLTIFTALEGFTISFITSINKPETVFLAAVLTAVMSGAVMLYALTTKHDFTMMGGSLFLIGLTLCAAGVLGLFFRAFWFQILLSLCGVLLGGVYLIYDVQLIAGNKENRFSVDDYIMAALCIYIDIVRIFLEILRLLALSERNR